MALIDDVKAVCDRLAPLGWRSLLKAVTGNQLDIAKSTAAQLKTALTMKLTSINRTLPGFRGLQPAGGRGHHRGRSSASLLYHALASARVVRDDGGAMLRGFRPRRRSRP